MQFSRRFLALTAAVALMWSSGAPARTVSNFKNHTIPTIQALRGGSVNHSSNIEFWQTNYGELFLDISVTNGKAGTFWPRGHSFSYIFGGGFWFGAKKNNVRHVLVGYNPASGKSWFQPGSWIAAKALYDSVKNSPIGVGRYPRESDGDFGNKYTIYYSTDFDKTTGKPLNPAKKLSSWPIWDTSPDDNVVLGLNHYFGEYVDNSADRDTSKYHIRFVTKRDTIVDSLGVVKRVDSTIYQKGGPAFISEEDMFTISNELDTTVYDTKANGRFYPLNIEVQRMIYSWGSEVNKNYVFIAYKIINNSQSTLDSCWLAPVMDADIGNAANDESGYYNKDTTLNLAIQWSDKEPNVPFANAPLSYPGVIGMDFLESPAVNANLTIKPGVHPNKEQLGLVRFKRWEIGNDPTDDDTRYAFMTGSLGNTLRDTATNQYSDKRFLMATGPFKLLPGDKAQVVIGLMIARDSANGDLDLQKSKDACITLDKRAQVVYDSNFRVPLPPEEPTFTRVVPLSGGTFLKWDSIAEFSFDPIGTGMDFLGYRLYRGRHDLSGENGTTLYDQYKNPYGFKLLKSWSLADLDNATYLKLRDTLLPPDNAPADVRMAYYQLCHKYMDSLTSHHTYYDFGDDDHSGEVTESEKLLNDVDYYYWISAFDAGDLANGVIPQQSLGKVGQSKIRVHPVSSYAGDQSTFQVLSTQGLLGGISNFQWRVLNQEVINQLLSGDTLSVLFTPHPYDVPGAYRTYGLDMRVRDDQKNVDVNYPYWNGHNFPYLYASDLAGSTLIYLQSDSTVIKTTPFGQTGDPIHVVKYGGLLNSVDTSFAPNQYLLNAIEHSMNYAFYQVVSQVSFVDTVAVYDTTITIHNGQPTVTRSSAPLKHGFWSPHWTLQPYAVSWPTLVARQHASVSVQIDTVNRPNGDIVISHTHFMTPDIIDTVGSWPFKILQGTDAVATYWDTTGSAVFDSMANQGAYDYIVEFSQGGIDTSYIKVERKWYFIPYLNVKVRAEQIYHVQIPVTNDTTRDSIVRIVYDCKPTDYMLNAAINAGEWSMDPVVWKLTPAISGDAFSDRSKQSYRAALNRPDTIKQYYSGLAADSIKRMKKVSPNQKIDSIDPASGKFVMKDSTYLYHSKNRYYLTTVDDTNKLIFVNTLSVGGSHFYLDSALKGRKIQLESPKLPEMFARDTVVKGSKNQDSLITRPALHDYQPGDVVRIRYVGGMLGLPTPGASFKTVFTPSVPQNDSSNVSASQLGNVHVWPNPYILGNSVDASAPGLQKPMFEDRLVFNHMPPHATIKLFNIAGELIRTIQHNGGSEEYWDLLSEGRQRVGSQLIIAQVKTPNGESQILKIAVIVQGR